MRAKIVNENIHFQRGKDPLESMKIGMGIPEDPMPGLNAHIEEAMKDPEILQFNKLRGEMMDSFVSLVDRIIIKGIYEEFGDAVVKIEKDDSYARYTEVLLRSQNKGQIHLTISPSSNYQSFEVYMYLPGDNRPSDTTKMARSIKILNKNIKKMFKENDVTI